MNPLASSPCPLFNAKPCRRSSVRRLLPVAERQHDDRIGQHQGESEFGDIRVRRSPPPSPPASIREVSLGRRASAAIRDCQLCVQTLLEWLAAIVGTRNWGGVGRPCWLALPPAEPADPGGIVMRSAGVPVFGFA